VRGDSVSGRADPASGLTPSVRAGLFYAVCAYTLWGMMPVYLKAVSAIPALEIVAHRIVWSVPFGAVLITVRSQWREVSRALTNSRVLMVLAIAAVCISLNWLIYVWAVTHDRILEASLGYYINPLMYVAAGVLILKETLYPLQRLAVGLAGAGVLVLTIAAGVFPWISLALAALFTGYGYIRKTAAVGAMPGLFIETLLLSPVSLIYLISLGTSGSFGFGQNNPGTDLLLILAGPVTVLPLLCFALGARRLTLVTIGIVQYIGPTLQFFFGLYYGEPFSFAHGVCFGLIWIALGVFSWDTVHRNRARTKMVRAQG